ncbi:acyl carrier protein [Spirochaetota bacterium]
MIEKIRSCIASLLDVEEGEIRESSQVSDFERWDSFAHLQIIMVIEENFSVKFTTEEVISIKSVQGLMNCIKEHL